MDYKLRDNRWTTNLETTDGLQTEAQQIDYKLIDNWWTADWGTTNRL